jgi:hypothetical protein
MMNLASKTHAHFDPFPEDGMYCEGVTKILRKIAHSRVVARNDEN